MKYAIKVYGGRGAGEYDGGNTLAAAVRRARTEFVPFVGPHDGVAIVRFSKDGERVITVKTLQERSSYGYGNRRRVARNTRGRFTRRR